MFLKANSLEFITYTRSNGTKSIPYMDKHSYKGTIKNLARARFEDCCEFADISPSLKYNSEYGDYELWNQLNYFKDSSALTIPEYEKEYRGEPLWAV